MIFRGEEDVVIESLRKEWMYMKQRRHGNLGLKVAVVFLSMMLLVTIAYGYFGITGLKAELERVQNEYAELHSNYRDLNVAYSEVLNYAEQFEKAN